MVNRKSALEKASRGRRQQRRWGTGPYFELGGQGGLHEALGCAGERERFRAEVGRGSGEIRRTQGPLIHSWPGSREHWRAKQGFLASLS